MSDNEILFGSPEVIVEYKKPVMKSNPLVGMMLGEGYDDEYSTGLIEYGYDIRLFGGERRSDDIYKYKGKKVAVGEFVGFLDAKHEIVHMGDSFYRNGQKILDAEEFRAVKRGPYIYDQSKMYCSDNVLVRVKNKNIYDDCNVIFYDLDGHKVKTINVFDLLGIDKETFKDRSTEIEFIGFNEQNKQSAFRVGNSEQIIVFDHKQINDIKMVSFDKQVFQEFTIFKERLRNVEPVRTVASVGETIVYDDYYVAYKLKELRMQLPKEEEYPYHDKEFYLPNSAERYDFINCSERRGYLGDQSVLYELDSDGRMHYYLTKDSVQIIIENMNSLEKKTVLDIYEAIIERCSFNEKQLMFADYVEKYRIKYKELYKEDIDDIQLGNLNKTAYEQVLDDNNLDIISSCFFDKYMNDSRIIQDFRVWDSTIKFTSDLEYKTVIDERKMQIIEKALDADLSLFKCLPSKVSLKYISLHPDKAEEFLKHHKVNDIDATIQPIIAQLYNRGVNILRPEQFTYALSGEQKLSVASKPFDIKSDIDFNIAFENLAKALYDGNSINAQIAELLLKKLVTNYRDFGNSLWNCYGINNAICFLKTEGIDCGAIDLENVSPKYVKKLIEQGAIQIHVEDYLKRTIDEFCPVNDTFINPFDKKTKTNLLDYYLQRLDYMEKVVALLNHGANVFANVERYSQKQDKIFPIKPFARFFDKMIYQKRTDRLSKIMLTIAEGLDADKEKVIDDIFASLPYKTKTNETIKNLQQQMHKAFREKHLCNKYVEQITNKIQELKEKTHTDNIADIPHAKMQILRELGKDNVSPKKGVVNRKRSNADKQIIKLAWDKVNKHNKS